MNAKRVVVIGDVMLDVVVRPMLPVAPTSDTPADVVIGRGGSGANLAVALAQSGHDVEYVGAGGNDPASELFVRALDEANVRAVLQETTGRTGTVVAMIAADGQRAMLTDRGANSMLAEAFVLASLPKAVDHVHLSGYVLLDPHTRSVGVAALRRATVLGATISVDVCSLAPLLAMSAATFLDSVSVASWLFANEEEAIALSGATEVSQALEMLSERFHEVVVTRGVEGVIASRGDERFQASAKSDAALDTTGAGDAATGAYLGARLSGGSVAVSLEAAMAAASVVVRGLGASNK